MPLKEPTTAGEPTLNCGNCRQPMQRLRLPGHYGHGVDLDLCAACDLVWFDGTETAQLSGPALLELIGEMASCQALPHEPLRAGAACPRCQGALRLVPNLSRWGRSSQLQCLRRDGAYQSFAQFLEEKGLLRPMSRLDRGKLLHERGHIDCVNCGGAIGAQDERCPFCHSVPSLLDVARLAHALDPEETIEPQAVNATPAQQQAMQCAACGVALPAGESISCRQCGATLAIPNLRDANASVQALAPALRAAALRPSAKVVKRRLEALDADLPRRREWVAGMEASAAPREERGDDIDWPGLWQTWRGIPVVVRLPLVALAVWLLWRYGR